MKKEVKYVHDISVHNDIAPNIVVKLIIDLFAPKSLLDVGCGIGTWLSAFKVNNVHDLHGIDGDYVDRSLLFSCIQQEEFTSCDLSLPFNLQRKYDLAICLEVAEHLPISAAETFVESLCRHSDIIIFAAAVPNQGGQNHLNEQWPEYWANIFKNNGYSCYDILRPLIWDNEKVFWWYKQNILIYSRVPLIGYSPSNNFLSLIHPEHFEQKIGYLNVLREKYNKIIFDLTKWENADKGIRKHWSKFEQAFIKKFIK